MDETLEKALFELTVAELPRKMVRELLQVLPLIYRDAYSRSFEDPAWEHSEAHDLCGHIRRTLVESRLRKIAIQNGLYAKPFRNFRATSNYTLVRAGRLVITQSAIQHEAQMVRPAMFRRQHSAINRVLAQPTLPELEIHPPELFARGEVYAILFHGPRWGSPNELGFVTIGFPCSDSETTLYRFPLEAIAKAQAGVASVQDIIKDVAKPRLKRKKGNLDQ